MIAGSGQPQHEAEELPDGIFCLHNPDSSRILANETATVLGNAASGPPTTNSTTTAASDVDGRGNGSVKVVCLKSLDDFRSNLVTHFNIAYYEQNEVIWPQRCGNSVPPPPSTIQWDLLLLQRQQIEKACDLWNRLSHKSSVPYWPRDLLFFLPQIPPFSAKAGFADNVLPQTLAFLRDCGISGWYCSTIPANTVRTTIPSQICSFDNSLPWIHGSTIYVALPNYWQSLRGLV